MNRGFSYVRFLFDRVAEKLFELSKIILDIRTNVWYIKFTNFEQTFREVELCTTNSMYFQIKR